MSVTALQPAELRFLERLRLTPRRSFSGLTRGERLSKRKGISIEFADFRDYSEGDDLRHLDWNVLARLDTPVMRTYQDEEDLNVYLLMDGSASMGFGTPTKWETAQRFAAALGFVGLMGQDAVRPWLLGSPKRAQTALRGRASFGRLVRWLDSLEIGVDVPISASLAAFARADVPTGVAVVLSDALDPEAPNAARTLGGRGHEVWWVQTLSDTELDPDIEGDLRLLDSEGGEPIEITASRAVIQQYRNRLDAHIQSLSRACRETGGRHALVRTSSTLEDAFRDVFRREGWVGR